MDLHFKPPQLEDDAPMTRAEQITDLITRANRTSGAFTISEDFLTRHEDGIWHPGAMAQIVAARRPDALRQLLLLHLLASRDREGAGRAVTLPASSWARALGYFDDGATQTALRRLSRNMEWLEDRRLVERARGKGRYLKVTPLSLDGSGTPYQRPDGRGKAKFLRIPVAFFEHELFRLDLPALAFLLIAFSRGWDGDEFEMPAARAHERYGISPKTFQRGADLVVGSGYAKRRLVRRQRSAAPDSLSLIAAFRLSTSLFPPSTSETKPYRSPA